ncbi:MAG: hypothetical protein OXD48_07095, partial [Litoreibacter sp.]|nr:hypothetical protein [Litoreibacter sp.]
MTKPIFAITIMLSLACSGAAIAAEKKFAGYVIKSKTQTVEGVMLADGYTPAEVMAFIRQDCASGRLGALSYVNKPYKRRGNLFQKFRTSCVGGPSPSIGKTRSVTVEVER